MLKESIAHPAQAWSGALGDYWAANSLQFDRLLARYDGVLWGMAGVSPADVTLDVGCGTGAITRTAALRSERGSATGLDVSASMLEVARAETRRQGLRNATFVEGDAEAYSLREAAFDLVVSRFGTMSFADPLSAFRNLRRALHHDGRLVMLVWQSYGRNEMMQVIDDSLGDHLMRIPLMGPDQCSLADPDQAWHLLNDAGFTGIRVTDVRQPLFFGKDADDASKFITSLVEKVHREDCDDALAEGRDRLRTALAARQILGGVLLNSAAWLITARRR
ncbi:class I SAM-dependent methyltransferase [Kribbella sp. CA-253562]|uniref:class I SAM-dependent methyltransferase n=1 Tax=Kribbella sp. CA-253562 TaxID=3239942 RepID=UPI003D8D53AD